MTTDRENARRAQPMPTPAQALFVYQQGQGARLGSRNPYAGRRVLGAVWARGAREARRRAYNEWRRREAAQRRG